MHVKKILARHLAPNPVPIPSVHYRQNAGIALPRKTYGACPNHQNRKIIYKTYRGCLLTHVCATGIKSPPGTGGCDKIFFTHNTLFRILKAMQKQILINNIEGMTSPDERRTMKLGEEAPCHA